MSCARLRSPTPTRTPKEAMNETHGPTPAIRASVDRLYWNSNGTVEELTTRLGMSRQALYACINPLAAGASCQECGGEMVFANRTSRTTRKARCTGCGATERVPADAPAPEGREPVSLRGAESAGRRRGWRQWTGGTGWAAALGVVAAAAAVEVALRRG